MVGNKTVPPAVRLPMSCRLFETALDAYFDGELNAESAACLREHLDACACCRSRLAERGALATLVRAAPSYSAPCHLWAAVLAQTHSAREAFVGDSLDGNAENGGKRLRNRVSKSGISRQLGNA
jgi:hypothetical protein